LPRHIAVLGVISLLTAMSSAMVYGLLPVFLVKSLGATMASVGFIEGIAEAMMALARIFSGLASDWMGRRKPLVLLGYAVSAVNKVMFPLAGAVSMVLAARVIDRIGKGARAGPKGTKSAIIKYLGIEHLRFNTHHAAKPGRRPLPASSAPLSRAFHWCDHDPARPIPPNAPSRPRK
jgi:MFS family permease